MPRRLLNIASIVCLVACVALMGMWLRSYHRSDKCGGRLGKGRVLSVCSELGRLQWWLEDTGDRPITTWTMESVPIDHWIEQRDEGVFVGFGVGAMGHAALFMTPYWFFVFVSGTLAMLFQLRWPWRFTLRSLFIVTTFLAFVLGMIAWLDRAWIGK